MSPTPGKRSKYPLLIAGKVRPWFEWPRLPTNQQSRIKVTRHSRSMGYFFRPVIEADDCAVEWINNLCLRYGVLRWERGKFRREKKVPAAGKAP